MTSKDQRLGEYATQLEILCENLDKNLDILKHMASHANTMTLNEYQVLANRTANPDDPIRLATAGLGAAGEAGELANAIKKHVSHGHLLDREKIIDESGDVLWYLAEIATVCGFTLEDVALYNEAKLQRRYPEGFDPERSKNRGAG